MVIFYTEVWLYLNIYTYVSRGTNIHISIMLRELIDILRGNATWSSNKQGEIARVCYITI